MTLPKNTIIGILHKNGYIQDIGQIDKETKQALNSLIRKGIVQKSREPWLGYVLPPKTTYTLIKTS